MRENKEYERNISGMTEACSRRTADRGFWRIFESWRHSMIGLAGKLHSLEFKSILRWAWQLLNIIVCKRGICFWDSEEFAINDDDAVSHLSSKEASLLALLIRSLILSVHKLLLANNRSFLLAHPWCVSECSASQPSHKKIYVSPECRTSTVVVSSSRFSNYIAMSESALWPFEL